MKNLKKVSVVRAMVINSILFILTSCVHPVTPTYFVNLNFPDYMFGVAFAVMSIATFMSSPFWGRLGSKIGYVKLTLIGIPGYGLGQIIFGMARVPLMSLIGRFVSGFFSAAAIVSIMAYIVNETTNENRSRYMAYYTALSSSASAMGYLIGGLLGDISISLTFTVQVICIFILTFIVALTLEEPESDKNYDCNNEDKKKIYNKKGLITAVLVTFLVGVFLCAFASTSYDNAFNYYIKAELDFPTSYNGIIKAVIGIISLIANFTINIYIINRTNVRKSLIFLILLCSVLTFIVPLITKLIYFIIGNIIFLIFNSMYTPIQQALVTMNINKNDSGFISGIYNSTTAAGKIFGSLFAGFAYSFGSKIPFFVASIAFMIAVIVFIVNYYQYSKKTI